MSQEIEKQGIIDLNSNQSIFPEEISTDEDDYVPRDTTAERPCITPLHEIPLAWLSCSKLGKPWRIADAQWCETKGEEIARAGFDILQERVERRLHNRREPSGVEGFSIAHSANGSSWGCILIWEDATDRFVACMRDGTPYVLPDYRGLGLGTQIRHYVAVTPDIVATRC